MPKLIIKDRMLIPKTLMSHKAVKQRYKVQLFEEKSCHKCDNKAYRPNDLCETCPAFKADYTLFKETEKHWSVPQGDAVGLQKKLDSKEIDYTVVDKRESRPFRYDWEFTGRLFGKNYIDENGIKRADQKKVVREWLRTKSGTLRASPRSGKTVMACYLSCRLKEKTLIMSHQFEFLQQFYRTYMGGYDRSAVTNGPDLENQYRRKMILFVEKIKDLEKIDRYDIVLINYQKFIYDLGRIKKYLAGKFGLLIVDEAHNGAAELYLKVLSAIDVKYRLNLTATPKRKDGRHKLIDRVMGIVTAEVDAISLVPNIEIYQSKAHPPTSYRQWHHAESWLSKSADRNKEITKQVFKDLKAGHLAIIIPVKTIAQQTTLAEMITKEARRRNDKFDENWPLDLAIRFNGQGGVKSTKRAKNLRRIDSGEAAVVIPILKMFKEGIDVKTPSVLYSVTPMSASHDKSIGSPAFYQLGLRICTPAKKPQPIIRLWLDNVGMFRSCLIGLFWNEIAANKYTGETGRYRIADHVFDLIKDAKRLPDAKSRLPKGTGWV